MLIFFILFFKIIFTYKVFFKTDYFNRLDGLDKIIFICLFLFILWAIITMYYIFTNIYQIIYLTEDLHPFDIQFFAEKGFHIYILPFIDYILTYTLLIILFILLHIFAFWMIIILYVPFIIIVPIPFIPFIVPIPLKEILLIPFKRLTERGILPLMRRLFLSIFSEQTIKHILISDANDVYSFFYDNLKSMINDVLILNEPNNEKISKGLQDDKYKTSTIDDENEEKSKEIIQSDSENKIIKNKIMKEYKVCVNKGKGLNKYGEDNTLSNTFGDNKNNVDCNFDTLKSYMKIKM